jgi:2-amino-4-hydroxy-6-hydroxymethyldihydropteridine diphosphokinase
MASVYLALGSNIGNREANLRMALRGLTRMARVEAVSSLYRSWPEGPRQPDYYNAACRIETGLEPLPLLRFLQALEHEIGRRPATGAAQPRPIDLDLLLYDDATIDEPQLTVPHPRMTGRAFVMRPLAEIEPEAGHPSWEKSAAAIAAKLDEGGLTVVSGPGWDGVVEAPQDVRL